MELTVNKFTGLELESLPRRLWELFMKIKKRNSTFRLDSYDDTFLNTFPFIDFAN